MPFQLKELGEGDSKQLSSKLSSESHFVGSVITMVSKYGSGV